MKPEIIRYSDGTYSIRKLNTDGISYSYLFDDGFGWCAWRTPLNNAYFGTGIFSSPEECVTALDDHYKLVKGLGDINLNLPSNRR